MIDMSTDGDGEWKMWDKSAFWGANFVWCGSKMKAKWETPKWERATWETPKWEMPKWDRAKWEMPKREMPQVGKACVG